MKLLTALVLLALSTTAYAQNIKGIELGKTPEEIGAGLGQHLLSSNAPMSPAESQALVAKNIKNFTIAGVQYATLFRGAVQENGAPIENMLTMKDGKLSQFIFIFATDRFDVIQASFQSKYPDMKCVDSTVQNAYGASYLQTTCTYQDLTIYRRAQRDLGGLVLKSDTELRAKVMETYDKAAKDL